MNSGPTHLKVFADTTRLRGRGWLWLAAFAAALALYVLTLSPDLVWQDSGDYQWQAARLSWPPDGDSVWCRPGDAVRVHPWFLVTAWVLARTGLWNYAYAANLASALGTALAAANVLLLGRLLTGRVWPAAVGAVSFAVGHAVWSHAVMAETYGWAAAFLSAECLFAWAYLNTGRARWVLLLFFVNGVALSNHLMAGISLIVFTVWLLTECLRSRARWRMAPAAAGCWLAGGALYWIVGALEYARTESVAATLRAMTVGRWAGSIFNLADLPHLLAKSVLYVGLNYPTPLVLAAFAGAVGLVRRRDAFGRLVLVLAALYLVWAARYKVVDQYAFFIPFYVFASVMIGVGVWMLWDRFGRVAPAAFLALALLPAAVYAVLPGLARRAGVSVVGRDLPYRDSYAYFLRPWQTGNDGARRFAEEALDSLPRGAALFADSTSRPPLLCVQKLEGRRPDVRLVTSDGLSPETVARYWGSKEDLLAEFAAEGRRVFIVSDHPAYMPAWMAEHTRRVPFGIVFEATDPYGPVPGKAGGPPAGEAK